MDGAPRFATPLAYTPPHLAERILQSRSALEGEHKRVTVLFCDLVGSTALAERLGPEEMYDLLNRFFETALEVVHLYEGTINQFLGDGFMALFGAPLAIEHHERQAVLAAVALRDEIRRRFQEVGRRIDRAIRIRVGINTGAVVVGRIGDNLRMDYTAIGDTTNVAARLQSRADPDAILVTEATYEQARAMFAAEAFGPTALPGREQPVPVYRITDRLPARSTLDADTGRPLSPFVARDRELAALHDALDQIDVDRGQVVGLIGDAGLGKSRLLAEFRRTLAGRRYTWLEGRCVSYGVGIPYLPILQLLRANCRIVDTDAPDEIARKVAVGLAEVGLDPAGHAAYLLHFLGVKEGVGPDHGRGPEGIQARTFDTLRELALRGSRRRPIVFVVEDLHWIDPSSLAFLMELVDAVAGAPILLLVTYRAGWTVPWTGKSYATQIALRPLGDADSGIVIESALGSLPVGADVRRAIAVRGEGNPLFLEELARACADQGATAAAQIPTTLQGLLMSRIDRLPEDEKLALQIASVIGREFSIRLLGAVWRGAGSLPDHLRELAHHEFLRQQSRTEDPSYLFKHALTRDVVYGSLLQRHRRHYHAAVARALEILHEPRLDEVVELLAHHWRLSDDDDRAVDYTLRAAVKAQRRWANAEALAFADAALERLAAMPDTDANRRQRIDAVLRQSEVRFALGQHAAQITALERLRPLVEASADPPRRAAWSYWMGFLHSLTGSKPEVAIDYCRQAATIAESEGLDELGAYADASLAQTYLVIGDLVAGLEAGERALASFEARGNRFWASRTLAHLSALANARGEWDRSHAYCDRALAHGRQMDDRRVKVIALLRMASTAIHRGHHARGLALCEEIGALSPTPFDAAAARAIRGLGLARSGHADTGVRELAAAVDWFTTAGLRYTRSLFALWLAEAQLASPDRAPARATVEDVLACCRDLGYRHLEGVALRLMAETVGPERPAEAGRHLDRAEDLLRRAGAVAELGKVVTAREVLRQPRGEVDADTA